jgi:hypothetical protein
MSKDDEVRRLATAWCSVSFPGAVPEQLKQIAAALYAIRNDKADLSKVPVTLLSKDKEVMAAVEHYFFARSQVATGEYSVMNMKAFIYGYQLAKRLGVDMRHNSKNPTTPPSPLQQAWALLGADQGGQDLEMENAKRKRESKALVTPPTVRLPPDFTGRFRGIRLDKVRY